MSCRLRGTVVWLPPRALRRGRNCQVASVGCEGLTCFGCAPREANHREHHEATIRAPQGHLFVAQLRPSHGGRPVSFFPLQQQKKAVPRKPQQFKTTDDPINNEMIGRLMDWQCINGGIRPPASISAPRFMRLISRNRKRRCAVRGHMEHYMPEGRWRLFLGLEMRQLSRSHWQPEWGRVSHAW